MGVAAADASEATAAETDAGARPVPAKLLPSPVTTSTAADDAVAAALIAVDASIAAASPIAPGGNVSRIVAVDDPGVTATTASVEPANCASIADCIAATSAAVSGFAKVI